MTNNDIVPGDLLITAGELGTSPWTPCARLDLKRDIIDRSTFVSVDAKAIGVAVSVHTSNREPHRPEQVAYIIFPHVVGWLGPLAFTREMQVEC